MAVTIPGVNDSSNSWSPSAYLEQLNAKKNEVLGAAKAQAAAISSRRFSILDRETNVGTASFDSSAGTSAYNSPENELKQTNSKLSGLIDTAKSKADSVKSQLQQAKDQLDAETSELRSQFDSFQDQAAAMKDQIASDIGTIKDEAGAKIGAFKDDFSAMKSKVGELATQANSEVASAKAVIDKNVRSVKDLSSKVLDVANMPKAEITGFLNTLSGGNATISRSLDSMLRNCSTKGLNKGLPGKPYDQSINCGSGKLNLNKTGGVNGCDAASYSDVLNKLTGGAYKSGYSDLNSALQAIMSLSGLGYKLGMCGVFGALSSGLAQAPLSKVSAGLLSTLATAGNTNGFLDVAKSSLNLSPMLLAPGIMGDFVSNFQLPGNVGENAVLETADRALGGMELLDTDWSKNPELDMLSWGFAENRSDDLATCFMAKIADRSFSEDNLEMPIESDTDSMMAAYLSDTNDAFEFGDMFA